MEAFTPLLTLRYVPMSPVFSLQKRLYREWCKRRPFLTFVSPLVSLTKRLCREWRKGRNEAIFKMEAGTKHGFNLGTGAEAKEGKGDAKGEMSAINAIYQFFFFCNCCVIIVPGVYAGRSVVTRVVGLVHPVSFPPGCCLLL